MTKTLYFILLFIGFSNAFALPMMGSVLSVWLIESGLDKETIGLFALFGIPFSLKLLWSPLIDCYCPSFCRCSPRRAWIFFALSGMSLSLLLMSFASPGHSLIPLGISLFLLSAFTGCLFVVGISYELESQEVANYSMGAAGITIGYRLGLLCGGAGALYFSTFLGWSLMLQVMAAILFIGALLVSLYEEPYRSQEVIVEKRKRLFMHKSLVFGFLKETIFEPCLIFFQNPLSLIVIFSILTFKAGDQLISSMSAPFYLSLGFDKITIAGVLKIWGMAATILGAALGGVWCKGKNLFLSLFYMGILHAASLICHCLLGLLGGSLTMLCTTVFIEHLTGGMAMVVFIAFLWQACTPRYVATQYVLLYSLYLLKGDFLSCLGGFLAATYSWTVFFVIALSLGVFLSIAALLLYVAMPVPKRKYL